MNAPISHPLIQQPVVQTTQRNLHGNRQGTEASTLMVILLSLSHSCTTSKPVWRRTTMTMDQGYNF